MYPTSNSLVAAMAANCLALLIVVHGAVAAPELKALLPAGATRGQVTVVQAVGTFPTWPVEVLCDREEVQVVADPDHKGQLRITVAEDAVPGPCWIRLIDTEGATRARAFVISTVSEFNEPLEAQPIPLGTTAACVVNGRLAKNDEVDVYRVQLPAGCTLTANLSAHEAFGSPMDAVLQLVDVQRDRTVLQNDDFRGLDPRIQFSTSQAGLYELRLFAFPETPDSRIGFAGGEDFVYRLELTCGRLLESTFPLSVGRDTASAADHPALIDRDPGSLVTAVIPREGDSYLRLYEAGEVGYADLRLEEMAVVAEQHDASREQPLLGTVPCVFSGRLLSDDPEDTYRFTSTANSRVRIEIESHALGFPLDPVLQALDLEGKQLARVDDQRDSRDASLDVKVPSGGQFDVVVTDLHRSGSLDHVYRLTATPIAPKFELDVPNETFALSSGEQQAVKITVRRKDGYADPIDICVVGLPKHVFATSATSVKGSDTETEVAITLTSDQPTRGAFRIIGVSAEGHEYVTATTPGTVPRRNHQQLYLVVGPLPSEPQ